MKVPPWSWIVAGWIVLLAATAVTITVCVRHAPETVPLEAPAVSLPKSHAR